MPEIIQIQVPTELAQRLRRHHDDLAQILEWGLRHVEEKAGSDSLTPATEPQETSQREDLLAALRSTGILIDLDPALGTKCMTDADQRRHTPIRVAGTPLSEMIIAERRERWSDDQ